MFTSTRCPRPDSWRDSRATSVAIAVLVEVDGQAELAGVVVPEIQAALGILDVVDERRIGARGVAPRRLDQQHLGADVAQQLAGIGPELARQFEDTDTVEGTHG